jgi:hypothetical protein
MKRTVMLKWWKRRIIPSLKRVIKVQTPLYKKGIYPREKSSVKIYGKILTT